jgi:hypothetical protein
MLERDRPEGISPIKLALVIFVGLVITKSSADSISIYVPNKDRDDNMVSDHRNWVEEAVTLMCDINGGATAMPPVDGAWKNERGAVIREHPVVVYSYVMTDAFMAAFGRCSS